MGTGPVSNNDDSKMPLGKDYWTQQAAEEEQANGAPWKGPDGSNNVPVGKTEAEVKNIQNRRRYELIREGIKKDIKAFFEFHKNNIKEMFNLDNWKKALRSGESIDHNYNQDVEVTQNNNINIDATNLSEIDEAILLHHMETMDEMRKSGYGRAYDNAR